MPDDRTYIRVHDGMPDHPKIEPLSDAAFRLLMALWCWSSRHLTDGRVPAAIWSRRGNARARSELMHAGLVEESSSEILFLHDYLEHQRSAAEVADLREKRRRAGSKGGSKRQANAQASAKQVLKQTASKTVPSTETETDTSTLGAKTRRQRPPDPIWDALVEALRIDVKQLTTTARGAVNRAVAELRAVEATPQQIAERAHAYRRTYPNTSLTPSALVKHWAQLNGHKPPAAPYHQGWPE